MSQLNYKLIGDPARFKNGRGKRSKFYLQRFRLMSESVRKVRSVSLETTDKSVARQRVVDYVEKRVRELLLRIDPKMRTEQLGIKAALNEYIRSLRDSGNTEKQASLVDTRINLVINKAGFQEYTEVDGVKVINAICSLRTSGQFKATSTANKYLEAIKAWTRWMYENSRWHQDPLALTKKIKGDTTNSRPRAILSMDLFDRLLDKVRTLPPRRNLTGIQRYWLYLIAAITGFRAQELKSLTPSNFFLKDENPCIEIRNTISKRGKRSGKKDQVFIRSEIADTLAFWLSTYSIDEPLWGSSRSWWYNAAEILRHDLNAAEIPHEVETPEGTAVIDFHSFRGLLVTNAVRTGLPTRTIMQVARLSSESLLKRYTKISQAEILDCVQSLPLPKLNDKRSIPSAH